ncbi:MAG: hypothetical protein LBB27_04455 [Tannerellaceae bacterium]|jgi:hypothetical protein|nr:hypothetical protein [Tannerellaceae bacterium]
MNDLPLSGLADHLHSSKPEYPLPERLSVRKETVCDARFDIQDKRPRIKQPVGAGSATYINRERKTLVLIDYENFLNQMPKHAEGIKRCDFIVYEEGKSVFILHELSQSSRAKNKRRDAKHQLLTTAKLLTKVEATRSFISVFAKKKCVFSNRPKTHPIPDVAQPFIRLPQAPAEYYLGFSFMETTEITV